MDIILSVKMYEDICIELILSHTELQSVEKLHLILTARSDHAR